jgi:hypothetical protein
LRAEAQPVEGRGIERRRREQGGCGDSEGRGGQRDPDRGAQERQRQHARQRDAMQDAEEDVALRHGEARRDGDHQGGRSDDGQPHEEGPPADAVAVRQHQPGADQDQEGGGDGAGK